MSVKFEGFGLGPSLNGVLLSLEGKIWGVYFSFGAAVSNNLTALQLRDIFSAYIKSIKTMTETSKQVEMSSDSGLVEAGYIDLAENPS